MFIPNKSLDLLYVSFGQRFGPQTVAVNLLEKILSSKEITAFAVVDAKLAAMLSYEHRKHVKVSINRFVVFLFILVTILKRKPRVCHFNFVPLYFSPILLLMKLLNVRIIYSFHGGILFEKKDLLQKLLFINQCRYFYNVIVVNSNYSAHFLLQSAPFVERKLCTIPNGITVSEQHEPVNLAVTGNPIVLFVGRLEYIKGIDILVKSIALTKEFLPEICLHVVGTGNRRGALDELVSDLGLEQNVVFHGFVTDAEKRNLYSVSDIVVVPSRNEPFGIVMLEAMLAGKPLIVSNRGALPEVVKNNFNGLVVNLMPDALAQAIVNLYNNSDLRSIMSQRNKTTVKSYDWEEIAKVYIKLYKM